MKSVKKVDNTQSARFNKIGEMIEFDVAVEEILADNLASAQTQESESMVQDQLVPVLTYKIRDQLLDGFILTTKTHHYYFINPVEDFINNIDDEITF